MRWVVGDIHGMLQPLATLLLSVRAADANAQFYFVGDYINRGKDSRSVIDLLIALKNDGVARFVRGNHDDVFDLLLNGQSFAPSIPDSDPMVAFNWFMQFGLAFTLKSYGVDRAEIAELERRPSPAKLRSIMNAIPDDHRKFIRDLDPMIEDRDVIVAHAMWDIHEPNDPQYLANALAAQIGKCHTLLWGRYTDAELAAAKAWTRPMFFGHTPVANYAVARGNSIVPIIGPSIVLLDTAAALGPGGRLTAFCIETGGFLQADPSGRLLRAEPAVETR